MVVTVVPAQQGGGLSPAEQQRRHDLEDELQSIAVVERKVMIPMRDGVRLATDIYRPKDASGPVPIVFSKTPYNFNFWDVRNGVPADMSTALAAVKRGYAYVVQNERGHFFSEGNYDILGAPITDGYDAIDWMTRQSWSNGKVGTTGCSSTAEWQMAVASLGHPGFAAMNVQGFGAGVGPRGPVLRAGQLVSRRRRADALHRLALRRAEPGAAAVPAGDQPRGPGRASRLFDLAPQMPPVDWDKALWHLPVQDILKAADGPRGIFADTMPVPTGGAMVQRTPNDPAWYKGGLWHDNMPLNVPGLWFMSWYDVSVGPNLAMFNHVRKTAKPEVADQQWAIIAPVAHCSYTRATADTVVGERSMGDARLDYNEIVYGFFDRFLKGEAGTRLDKLPKVTYFTMGSNQWQTSDTWPPAGAQPMTFYLSSGGQANSLYGDGALSVAPPAAEHARRVHLRPAEPGGRPTAATCAAPATPCRRARSTSAGWKPARTSWSTPPSRSRRAWS